MEDINMNIFSNFDEVGQLKIEYIESENQKLISRIDEVVEVLLNFKKECISVKTTFLTTINNTKLSREELINDCDLDIESFNKRLEKLGEYSNYIKNIDHSYKNSQNTTCVEFKIKFFSVYGKLNELLPHSPSPQPSPLEVPPTHILKKLQDRFPMYKDQQFINIKLNIIRKFEVKKDDRRNVMENFQSYLCSESNNMVMTFNFINIFSDRTREIVNKLSSFFSNYLISEMSQQSNYVLRIGGIIRDFRGLLNEIVRGNFMELYSIFTFRVCFYQAEEDVLSHIGYNLITMSSDDNYLDKLKKESDMLTQIRSFYDHLQTDQV